MMTLKERYQKKQNLLIEQLILEKFNKETINQAVQLIKSLKSINFSGAGLDTLSMARDLAIQDANRAIGGKSNQGIVRKIIGLFKDSSENPVVDSIAYANAVLNFFEAFNEYISAYNSDGAGNGSTVRDLIVGNDPDDDQAKENIKLLQNVIIKGLKPDGVLAQVGKTWQKKYFKNNWKQLANDIMYAKVSDILKVGKQAINTLKNSKSIGQAAAGAADIGSQYTTSSTGTEHTSTAQQTSGSEPATKTKETLETGESASDSSKVEKIFQRLEKANISKQLDIPSGQIQVLIQLLDKLGHIK